MFPTNNFKVVTVKFDDSEKARIKHQMAVQTWTGKEKKELLQAVRDVVQDYKLKYKDAWKKEFLAKAPQLIQNHPYAQKQLRRFHLY